MNPGVRQAVPVVAVAALILVVGPVACTRVTVDPIEVKPIHIVHDINIRVDRQLDDFFAYQDQATTQPSATQQATTQTVAGDVR